LEQIWHVIIQIIKADIYKSTIMKSIVKELNDCFGSVISSINEKEEFVLYKELNLLGNYCVEHFDEQKSKEIIGKINALYEQKDLFICNAIENEFLIVLVRKFQLSQLTEQLKALPESLWAIYIKVLLETLKNDKQ